jgi:uncharacterized DUF497 family protein
VRIDRVLWSSRSVAHIARHEITPEEVEDVLFNPPLDARRGKHEGTYLVFGRTRNGRRLVVVIAPRPRNSWYVVTARDVDRAERRRMRR